MRVPNVEGALWMLPSGPVYLTRHRLDGSRSMLANDLLRAMGLLGVENRVENQFI
jgi:hypothetical protein